MWLSTRLGMTDLQTSYETLAREVRWISING
jgi:hypothetical protein